MNSYIDYCDGAHYPARRRRKKFFLGVLQEHHRGQEACEPGVQCHRRLGVQDDPRGRKPDDDGKVEHNHISGPTVRGLMTEHVLSCHYDGLCQYCVLVVMNIVLSYVATSQNILRVLLHPHSTSSMTSYWTTTIFIKVREGCGNLIHN